MTASRAWILWAVIGLAVVGSVVLFGRESPGSPLDPRSTKPGGTKALVYLLEAYGAGVDLTSVVPSPRSGQRVVVLADHLSAAQHDSVAGFVEGGGELVVADPSSPLGVGGSDGARLGPIEDEFGREVCSVSALAGLSTIKVSAPALSLPVRDGDGSCFGDGRRAYVVVHAQGPGTVVALGGASQWTNDLLDEATNAGLATALLAPRPGDRVVILSGDGSGGDQGLFELVPNRVWFALGQLAVAFVVVALWRGRRLGRVLGEPQPAEIAGSELVVASGRILDRIGQPGRAADMLRRELVHDLAVRYGGRTGIDPGTLDAAVSAGSRIPPGTLLGVLSEPVEDERALVGLAGRVDRIRQEVL